MRWVLRCLFGVVFCFEQLFFGRFEVDIVYIIAEVDHFVDGFFLAVELVQTDGFADLIGVYR